MSASLSTSFTVRRSKERPVLLILDNVDAHISPTAIDLVRENGVVMLTIPPQTLHYLRPLDQACSGSSKLPLMWQWMGGCTFIQCVLLQL